MIKYIGVAMLAFLSLLACSNTSGESAKPEKKPTKYEVAVIPLNMEFFMATTPDNFSNRQTCKFESEAAFLEKAYIAKNMKAIRNTASASFDLRLRLQVLDGSKNLDSEQKIMSDNDSGDISSNESEKKQEGNMQKESEKLAQKNLQNNKPQLVFFDRDLKMLKGDKIYKLDAKTRLAIKDLVIEKCPTGIF